jgi:hypothetical protein
VDFAGPTVPYPPHYPAFLISGIPPPLSA